MRTLLIVTCVILSVDNFIGASQHRLNQPTLNNARDESSQGQGQYYVPLAYITPYQAYRQILTDSQGPSEAEEYQQPQQQQQFRPYSSRFPSLVNPSISLNGPDGLSKYKPSGKQAKAKEPLVETDNVELRNLLASIQAIQPVVNERLDVLGNYIKQASHRQATGQTRPRLLPSRDVTGQQEYYDPQLLALATAGGQTDKAKPNKPLLFQAESMVNPYDELREDSDDDADSVDLDADKRAKVVAPMADATSAVVDHSNKVTEPKARRKLTGGASMLQHDRNVVLSPKPYQQPIGYDSVSKKESILGNMSDIYFVAIVACVSSVAIFSVIGAGYCFYKVQQSNKAAQDVEFPAYGVIGPASRPESTNSKCASPPADRKMAQSAQMYHYHHQKQQMISNEKNVPRNANNGSDIESDEENEDGEYTVYECPGLAPTGEMEVKNPLFQDDLTPMSSPSVNGTKQDSPKVNGAANESKLAKESTKPSTTSSTKSDAK